jgi:hypothetical protein
MRWTKCEKEKSWIRYRVDSVGRLCLQYGNYVIPKNAEGRNNMATSMNEMSSREHRRLEALS